jgi:hypothetical protein
MHVTMKGVTEKKDERATQGECVMTSSVGFWEGPFSHLVTNASCSPADSAGRLLEIIRAAQAGAVTNFCLITSTSGTTAHLPCAVRNHLAYSLTTLSLSTSPLG